MNAMGSGLGAAFIRFLRGAHRVLALIEAAGIAAASIGVLTMMFLTAIDVVLRYVVGSPLSWWYDFLMNYVLVAAFYLAFAYTLAHHGHLEVDFFMHKMPRAVSSLALAGGFLASGALLFLVSQSVAREAMVSYQHGDVLAGVIAWPVWVTKAIIAWAMFVMACRCLHFAALYLATRLDASAFDQVGVAQRRDELQEATQ